VNGEFDADLVFGGAGDDEIGAGFDPDAPATTSCSAAAGTTR
jgi:hypothetical protein